MTKKEFIQLVIRFTGIILLITSLSRIIKGFVSGLAMLMILPDLNPSVLITIWALAGPLVESIIMLIVICYLLFRGKLINNIVNRTSSLESEDLLQKENITEILIRFIAIWWFWKILRQIFSLIYTQISMLLLSHPEWFVEYHDGSKEFPEKLRELLDPTQEYFLWSTIASIVLYTLLAWYFLKGGKLFINLLTRRWLGKQENTTQTGE
ncbi:MAG: hypothetical protein ACYTER_02915 [Planctomycetota bacterium]|jgi:hypothetical protein